MWTFLIYLVLIFALSKIILPLSVQYAFLKHFNINIQNVRFFFSYCDKDSINIISIDG